MPLSRQGLEVLKSRRFDVVYFSTTQHLLTCAGPWWRRKTGVPYVADVHDPVFIPKPKYRTSRSAWKAWVARGVGRWIEKIALAQADGIVSVSNGYVDDLLLRHPTARWAVGERGSRVKGLSNEGKLERVLVQPFPADERGLGMVKEEKRETSKKRIVYVGAGGNIMEKGWRVFLAQLKKEPLAKEVVIEIYGTDPFWKMGDRLYLQEIADEMGLKGVVVEDPTRVSYERSLALVKGADGLLVLGVDDPGYQPSKLHTYLASGLPVIVLARFGSTLPKQLEEVEGTQVLSFGELNDKNEEDIISEYFKNVKHGKHWPKRSRLSVSQGLSLQIKLLEDIISGKSKKTSL